MLIKLFVNFRCPFTGNIVILDFVYMKNHYVKGKRSTMLIVLLQTFDGPFAGNIVILDFFVNLESLC